MFNIKTEVEDYMSIIVTHECNRTCSFCVDKYRGNKEYITIGNVIDALCRAKNGGVKDILLVGGEPTMHPDILEIANTVKLFGFNLILTTNYSKEDTIKDLDGIVDSFNISFHDQEYLPLQSDFKSDITLSALIYKGQLDTREKLDLFIDKYRGDMNLKFSTLYSCNDFAKDRQVVGYLDSLPARKVRLFNEIEGLIYNGFVIKRYDRIVNKSAKQSLKCHVDGKISSSWDR